MKKEEQLGMPPVELIHQVLEDNHSLLRLLRGIPDDTAESGLTKLGADIAEQSQSVGKFLSTYREVLKLLEILSATSGDGRAPTPCLDGDTSAPSICSAEDTMKR